MNKKVVRSIVCLLMALALVIPGAVPPAVNAAAAEPVISTAASKTTASKQSIALKRSSVTLTAGDKLELETYGTKATITWSTSDKKVATVSKKGVVTAKAAGTATITAQADGKKATCTITVVAAALEKKKASIAVGESVSIMLNGSEIASVSSSDSKVVVATKKNRSDYNHDDYYYYDSIRSTELSTTGSDAYGEVTLTGLAKGSATVTVKGVNGKSYKITVTVTDPYVLVKEVETTTEDGETETAYTEYKYDKYGHVTEEKITWPTKTTVYSYTYEGSSLRSESQTVTKNGEEYSYYRYDYDAEGRETVL